MQQESRQLDTGLPATRHGRDGAVQVRAFQFKTAGDLAAFPIGFAAVAHEEVENGFAGMEGVVLAQVPKSEARMQDDLATIELFLAQNGA